MKWGREARTALAYQRLFQMPNGQLSPDARTVIDDLTEHAKAIGSPVTHDLHGRVDVNAVMIRVGRQDLLQRILDVLHVDLVQLMGVAQTEEKYRGAEAENGDDA